VSASGRFFSDKHDQTLEHVFLIAIMECVCVELS
jgi:hypothetical protein